jgi:ribosomal protein S18 acetylase RimI-like enzyme
MVVFIMATNVIIEQLELIGEYKYKLSELLVKVVEGGASIGFLPPLKLTEANDYWENVTKPDVVLYVARIDAEIVGSVQLNLCIKPNGIHRAEIGKLMTHPNFRRLGIGRMLMERAEERAKQEKRSLLVLDTREGDSSNLLYKALGFVEAGKIPHYAKSANGELHATVFYYKAF